MRNLMLAALLVLGAATTTWAKAPTGQGRACDARNRCPGEMPCVKHRDGKSTCEIPCTNSSKCPEDQRCVKDGDDMLCRSVTDL
jgi:hypothetical protein